MFVTPGKAAERLHYVKVKNPIDAKSRVSTRRLAMALQEAGIRSFVTIIPLDNRVARANQMTDAVRLEFVFSRLGSELTRIVVLYLLPVYKMHGEVILSPANLLSRVLPTDPMPDYSRLIPRKVRLCS